MRRSAWSALRPHMPSPPRPPALVTAAANPGVLALPIGACRIGHLRFNLSVKAFAGHIRVSSRPCLTFFRQPAISLGAGAAHQHGPLSVAQAVSLKKGLDGLLVVDDCGRARPVRAPQAAIETPGVEQAGKRVPDVRERIRLPG